MTDSGLEAARQQVRRHRLWEHYLAMQADVAPSHVDRGADDIEHVIGPRLFERLEAALHRRGVLRRRGDVPDSLHRIDAVPGESDGSADEERRGT